MPPRKLILLLTSLAIMAICAIPGVAASELQASEQQSTGFGVGAVVVPRIVDPSTLPPAVAQADAYLPGYARQWYIARINLQAGRSTDDFASWSRLALSQRWDDPSFSGNREDVYRLLLASQRELAQASPGG